MSNCRRPATEGVKFWIICKRLAFLSCVTAYKWFKISAPGVRWRRMWQLDKIHIFVIWSQPPTHQCLFIKIHFRYKNYWIFPIFPSYIHKKKNLVWSCLFFAFPYLTLLHFMQQTDWYRNSDKEFQFELWRFKVE